MTISISSKQEKVIKELVKKGRFKSSDHAVNTAIELLEEQEELLIEIEKGIESGPSVPFPPQ